MKNKEKHIDFYPNGQKEEEGTLVNGKKDGIWKEWWDNGIQRREIKWKLGVRNGVCIWWDKEGKKTTQGRYLNHLKNGEWNTYLDGKKIILKEYFEDDRKEGESIGYYENGDIQSKTNFKNDMLHGLSTHFLPNGDIENRGKWIYGREVGYHIKNGEKVKRKYLGDGTFIDQKGRLIKFRETSLEYDNRRQDLYDYKCFILPCHRNAKSVSYGDIRIAFRLMELFLRYENPNCIVCDISKENMKIIFPYGEPEEHHKNHIRDYASPGFVCDKCSISNIKKIRELPYKGDFNGFVTYIKFIENELSNIKYQLDKCQYCESELFQFISFTDNDIKVQCLKCDKEAITSNTRHKIFD